MALNPTDIDVTNQFLITHMTEEQLKELESSESGLPENAIITTSDIDENISCLRTEVVYDMTSSDANINLGYTSGIGTGVTINKDFSKYDFLVCEYLSYNNSIVGFCDLSQPTMPSDTIGRYVLYAVAYVQNGYQELIGIINLEKTTLTTYLPGSGVFASKIAKIYGILKTPSMIYTGHKLFAGNGISLNNGIISQKQRCSVNISGYNDAHYSSPGWTTEGVIISGTFTKYDEASSLLISYASSSFYVTGGGCAYCKVSIDDVNVGYSDALTNSSDITHSISKTVIATNISAGTHSFKWTCWSDASNRKANIAAYNTFSIAIQEI